LAKNPTYHNKQNHIPIKYHFVRQVINDCGVSLEKVHTKENYANMFTKPILLEKLQWLCFSWLAKKVMKKRKDQGIRLIVVKVEIVEYANEFPRFCRYEQI